MHAKPHMHGGAIVPMITPFTSHGAVDEAAAARLAVRLADCGISVFVLGTTGETASIPRTERARLVETVVRAVKGRVPVYAGIGDNCFTNTLEAARRYLGFGVTAVVSHLPSYYPLTGDEMQGYFELLHDRVEGPLVLYNIPVTTGMSLPLEIVERLSGLPRIIGFKDSERDEARMNELAARMAGRDDFALFMGTAAFSVKALRLGYQGFIPNSGNLIPEIWQQLYDHALRGEWAAANELQQQADAVARVFQENRTLGQSLAALKVLLEEQGLCSSIVLPPLRTLNRIERDHLLAEVASMEPACQDGLRPAPTA